MTGPPRNQIVLIVDEDLGFLVWLGQLLSELGYRTVPASGYREAVSHLKQLKVSVNLVIVNHALRGVASLLEELSGGGQRTRVVLIRDPGADVPPAIPEPATLEKPRSWERISRQEWLDRIRQALLDAPPLSAMAANRGGS